METENKKIIKFTGCKTYGDEVEALVYYYATREIGSFVLERATEKIKAIKAKQYGLIESVIKGAD